MRHLSCIFNAVFFNKPNFLQIYSKERNLLSSSHGKFQELLLWHCPIVPRETCLLSFLISWVSIGCRHHLSNLSIRKRPKGSQILRLSVCLWNCMWVAFSFFSFNLENLTKIWIYRAHWVIKSFPTKEFKYMVTQSISLISRSTNWLALTGKLQWRMVSRVIEIIVISHNSRQTVICFRSFYTSLFS